MISVPIFSGWILGSMITVLLICFLISVQAAISSKKESRIVAIDEDGSKLKRCGAFSFETLAVFTGLWPLLAFTAD